MNIVANNLLNKRLPSVVGLFFLVLSVTTIGWLSRNAILTGSKAAVSNIPKNVQISNISDLSFTVSYVTYDSVVGSVNYGKSQQTDQIALDDRDQETGNPAPHFVHHITLRHLDAATKYYFTLTSGDKNFSNNNTPYTVTTAPVLSDQAPVQAPVTGNVTLVDGSIPTEAIAYVSTDTSQLLSTLGATDGSYRLPLDTLRKKELNAFASLLPDITLHLLIVNQTAQSHVSLLRNQTENVPMITLSKEYDFAVSDLPLSPSPTASDSASETITPAAFPTSDEPTSTTPQIINPQDGESFKDPKPVFKGTAAPDAEVDIIIHSSEAISASVQTDSNGNWQYRPTTALTPGNHTITISTTDAQGFIKTITQSFVVYAEGSQFTEPSLSPAASPTKTPTPTAKATPTSTPKPTTKPTATPTPTTKVTPTVTVTTTPTTLATPTLTKTPTKAT